MVKVYEPAIEAAGKPPSNGTLAAPHKSKGTPWSQTRKENPESQTARIPDSLVREWFAERVNPAHH
jgi:hypothetical protein